ncbi:type IV pilus modification protein PilV [Halioxenophilus aromaticivorans]|uniref:Type IV pilus modification protein PilV n=1 Tax=Halioxenophilus aromaticivorans TaxID=1306992 RepID=A0AAV3TYW3_9ALTE
MMHSVQHQRGITLIEILVTVIILSIGFLGLASVQLMGTKNVTNSQYRTVATLYAYDMVERMRANIAGINANSYNNSKTSSATDPNCTTCSFADQADLDVYQWKQMIEAKPTDGGLPGGAGEIEFDSDEETYEITITWNENVQTGRYEQDDSDTEQELVLTVRL